MSLSQRLFRIFASETILGKLHLFHESHTKMATVYPEIKCGRVS